MLISLIVPCYNEEEAMPLFYQEAARVAAQMEKSHGAEFEIIFVDDGSKDGTLRVARELHDADPRVRYVYFSRNFGKEAGIYAGLKRPRVIMSPRWTLTCRTRLRCCRICWMPC